jgi:hypothetical protein
VTIPIVERSRPPLTGDERTLLTGFLDFHRDTVRIRCAELAMIPADQPGPEPPPLVRPVELVAHLRWLEHFWCEVVLGDKPGKAPYTEHYPADTFRVYDDTTLPKVLAGYERQCETSRRILADLSLDHEVQWHDRKTNVRWVFLHLIEETARHNGHLDAVREVGGGGE